MPDPSSAPLRLAMIYDGGAVFGTGQVCVILAGIRSRNEISRRVEIAAIPAQLTS